MTTRIFHRDGSWWSMQPDPSGGEIRCRYPNGRAAMVALDPRNREKARKPRTAPTKTPLEQWFDRLLLRILEGPATKDDYVLVPGPDYCPPSTPTTKDCE